VPINAEPSTPPTPQNGLFRVSVQIVIGFRGQLKFQTLEETWMSVEMGRKKINFDAKKTQVSISLSNYFVQRIDSITTQRSRWIRRAIKDKFDGEKGLIAVESKQMIALLMNRHRDDIEIEELLFRVLKKLPESGD
jgi:tRNA/tmRNA/rRNA uracil-C5-methylase (TrmA/RlmC/RlmD family)